MASLKDCIGNKLTDGSLVFWKVLNAVATIKEIRSGGIVMVRGARDNSNPGQHVTPGIIVLQIEIPFDPAKAGDQLLTDFIAVHDPEKQSQSLLEMATAGERV